MCAVRGAEWLRSFCRLIVWPVRGAEWLALIFPIDHVAGSGCGVAALIFPIDHVCCSRCGVAACTFPIDHVGNWRAPAQRDLQPGLAPRRQALAEEAGVAAAATL